MAAAGTLSRFAVLAVDDSSDDGKGFQTVVSSKKGKVPAAENPPKKKSKKKKKKPTAVTESNEEVQSRQQHLDELQYEKDLEEALLLSKISAEEQKSTQPAELPEEAADSDRKKNRKKKKNKSHTVMSVEEFNRLGEKPAQQSEDEFGAEPSVLHTRLPDGAADEQFFTNISSESSKIILKEKVHEDFKQQYRSGQAAATILQRKLDEKGEEVERLQQQIQQLQLELREEKERTAALQATLTSASMSKAASLVQTVKQLSLVKDELSSQLEENMRCLEQERTTSRQLRTELDRYKSKR